MAKMASGAGFLRETGGISQRSGGVSGTYAQAGRIDAALPRHTAPATLKLCRHSRAFAAHTMRFQTEPRARLRRAANTSRVCIAVYVS
jgi:hypothetical protein